MMTCKPIGKDLFDLAEKAKSVRRTSYGPLVKLWKEKCKDCHQTRRWSENQTFSCGQNILIKKIIKDLCSLFTPGGHLIYVGDTNSKCAYYDSNKLAALGVTIKEFSKMPDVVVHHIKKNWLVLIEAVTSHGPVNPKRHQELKNLFAGSFAGLVFVTAFIDRHAMLKYLTDISWETEFGLPNRQRI
jgi:hypothetical protein